MEADQRHLEPYDEAAAAAAGGARTSYREADRVTVRNVSLRYLRVMISSGDVIENAVASDAILSSLHQHQAVGHWQGRLVIGPRRGQKNVLIRGFQKIHLRACGFSAYDEKRPKLSALVMSPCSSISATLSGRRRQGGEGRGNAAQQRLLSVQELPRSRRGKLGGSIGAANAAVSAVGCLQKLGFRAWEICDWGRLDVDMDSWGFRPYTTL
ncbi:hypothetical protein AXG93_3825s1050 [Marchantia polymorpha subsp. ruderalis]|uniref:Uncharacterized protein n=1 Tax=Marchantia polymorpha subsp. ruderalis TaxID=1480154 RepID=A0A176WA37_MARPO|nr:hypothetical protein AXG93_3825s1050 [Marchantia polymorpha subsp. ruderalis]